MIYLALAIAFVLGFVSAVGVGWLLLKVTDQL